MFIQTMLFRSQAPIPDASPRTQVLIPDQGANPRSQDLGANPKTQVPVASSQAQVRDPGPKSQVCGITSTISGPGLQGLRSQVAGPMFGQATWGVRGFACIVRDVFRVVLGVVMGFVLALAG